MNKVKGKILLSGSSGFVGSTFVEQYGSIVRKVSLRSMQLKNIDWSEVNYVVHAAGIPLKKGTSTKEYQRVNTKLTRDFAIEAKNNNVTYFIFISSTKVFGDQENKHFAVNDICQPKDAYALSKYNAEIELKQIEDSGFKICILRPCMVYGLGCKGNISGLVKAVMKGFPIPLKSINNRRSMVNVENLCCFIYFAIEHKLVGTFLVTDSKDYSTSELIEEIQKYSKRKQIYFSMPKTARIILKGVFPNMYERLFQSLTFDSLTSYHDLGFKPEITLKEGIKRMLGGYNSNYVN